MDGLTNLAERAGVGGFGTFIDVGCDTLGCQSSETFIGASWRECEAVANAQGWVIDHGTQQCLCPSCTTLSTAPIVSEAVSE
jgi:hypothetical protein